jgi:hypothetical protein
VLRQFLKQTDSCTLYAFIVLSTGYGLLLAFLPCEDPELEVSREEGQSIPSVAFISLNWPMIGSAHSTPLRNHLTPSRAQHTNDTSSLPVGQ